MAQDPPSCSHVLSKSREISLFGLTKYLNIFTKSRFHFVKNLLRMTFYRWPSSWCQLWSERSLLLLLLFSFSVTMASPIFLSIVLPTLLSVTAYIDDHWVYLILDTVSSSSRLFSLSNVGTPPLFYCGPTTAAAHNTVGIWQGLFRGKLSPVFRFNYTLQWAWEDDQSFPPMRTLW